jgi:hypothetical protein
MNRLDRFFTFAQQVKPGATLGHQVAAFLEPSSPPGVVRNKTRWHALRGQAAKALRPGGTHHHLAGNVIQVGPEEIGMIWAQGVPAVPAPPLEFPDFSRSALSAKPSLPERMHGLFDESMTVALSDRRAGELIATMWVLFAEYYTGSERAIRAAFMGLEEVKHARLEAPTRGTIQ